MRVTLLQCATVWNDPQRNISEAGTLISKAPKSDLYILPEMWTTGFAIQPDGIAESDNGIGLQWMRKQARLLDAAIAGSIAVRNSQDGTFRNRFYFVRPEDTEPVFYDKHHLFTYGGEDQRYTAGNDRVIVEWRGVSFLLLVCYDLRFPVWSRNHEDYDTIIYVANWPASRIEAWRTLLKARAIENQCYVIGVNRVGTDPSCRYGGGTTLTTPYGVSQECPEDTPAYLSGNIDMESLRAFRHKFPVLKDRD